MSFLKLSAAASLLAALTVAVAARADLIISLGATANVACGSGTCTATAKNAVLNAGTLKTMLAAGNVTVTTGSIADRLVIHAPLAWTGKTTLSLHARQQISVEALVAVRGFGGMALSTGDGTGFGNLAYAAPGRIAFRHPLSTLTINGLTYKLVTNIGQLAAAASANANAYIALADNYDASPDGTYSSAAPVPTFNGLFEGLGNTISNLNISIITVGHHIGLFGDVGKGCERCGRIDGIVLTNATVKGAGDDSIGGLVGVLDADVSQSSVAGMVRSGSNAVGGLVGSVSKDALIVQSHANVSVVAFDAGGLVGENQGVIHESHAEGDVSGADGAIVGGLVAQNEGTITASFATGIASAHGRNSMIGGLVGNNSGSIRNCYATGTVKNIIIRVGTSSPTALGGLVGRSSTAIIAAYSSGSLDDETDPKDYKGGFIGFDGAGDMKSDYWDLTTSGVSKTSAGAGNIASDSGITGLTTDQLSAKLPAGLVPAVWAINSKINSGLPYLIANPPPSQ